jgi:putative oxidoreductase
MRIASLIARYLLALIFLVFGLNGFFHFIPMPPTPDGPASSFMGAMFLTHFLVVVFLLQIVPAVLLFANRYVPLALTLLGPVIVNIFLFHAFMQPSGLPLAFIVVILWLLVFRGVRPAFNGIFENYTAA